MDEQRETTHPFRTDERAGLDGAQSGVHEAPDELHFGLSRDDGLLVLEAISRPNFHDFDRREGRNAGAGGEGTACKMGDAEGDAGRYSL